MPDTRLALLRHGRTEWNRLEKIQGRQDSPLTKAGQNQGLQWGRRLKSYAFTRILASTLGRARSTAELINSSLNLPLTVDFRLVEQDWGDWAGLTLAEIAADYHDDLVQAEAAGWAFRPPGGEDRLEVLRRSTEALNEAAQRWPGQRILVVTHEGVIKCLIYRLLERRFLPLEKKVLNPDSLQWLTWSDGELILDELNALTTS